MNGGSIMKNAPNSIIVCVTVGFLAIIAAFVTLAVTGSDATEMRSFINTLLNIVVTVFSGGTLIAAGAAAVSSRRAVQQTNGLQDEERKAIAEAAAKAAIAEYIRKEQASGR